MSEGEEAPTRGHLQVSEPHGVVGWGEAGTHEGRGVVRAGGTRPGLALMGGQSEKKVCVKLGQGLG